MRDGHEAAGRQRCDQPVDDAVGVVRVRVVVQEVPDGDQQQAHRFGEVDEGAQLRVGQDPLGVTQVGLRDPGRHPFVGEQGTGMHDDLRVVVDVDDPGRWVDRLGDLVGVLPGRQSGADVDDLGNALHLNDSVTARARNARLFRALCGVCGERAAILAASSRSTVKVSLPPSAPPSHAA